MRYTRTDPIKGDYYSERRIFKCSHCGTVRRVIVKKFKMESVSKPSADLWHLLGRMSWDAMS